MIRYYKNLLLIVAFTDENNIVTENSETTLEIEYSDLTNAKKLISIVSFSTKPENEHVNIYPQYRLDINLSAKINSRIGRTNEKIWNNTTFTSVFVIAKF